MSYHVPRVPNDVDPGPAFALTPAGQRALEQAKRWRRDRYRRALYTAGLTVAFALGTLCGLVLH